jgi:hypothetical protein
VLPYPEKKERLAMCLSNITTCWRKRVPNPADFGNLSSRLGWADREGGRAGRSKSSRSLPTGEGWDPSHGLLLQLGRRACVLLDVKILDQMQYEGKW